MTCESDNHDVVVSQEPQMPMEAFPQDDRANIPAISSPKSLHIAPMLHVSNTEFRNFFRILTKKAVLVSLCTVVMMSCWSLRFLHGIAMLTSWHAILLYYYHNISLLVDRNDRR